MASIKKSVYIESSILSFLCADPSTVQSTFEKQRDTLKWWHHCRADYSAFTSDEVVFEISRGLRRFAERRLEKAAELQLIAAVQADRDFAQKLILRKLIPPSAEIDATHLAIAVRSRMDILLTWNLKHLANPEVLPLVYNFLNEEGCHRVAITTPSALMESH